MKVQEIPEKLFAWACPKSTQIGEGVLAGQIGPATANLFIELDTRGPGLSTVTFYLGHPGLPDAEHLLSLQPSPSGLKVSHYLCCKRQDPIQTTILKHYCEDTVLTEFLRRARIA